MEFYLDTADVRTIESMLWFPLQGVTTNPSIVAREKKEFFGLIDAILRLGIKELHCQVLGQTAADIKRDARRLVELAPCVIVPKIPVTAAGIEAMSELSSEGMRLTATGVFTVTQGVVAARSGASFVAPYVNRIESLGESGLSVAKELAAAFQTCGLETKVLAASVKTAKQIRELMLGGVHSITVQPSVLLETISHPLNDQALDQFRRDWLDTFETEELDAEVRKG